MIDGELGQSARSPARAILLQSPGREPWVSHSYTFIEPQRGGTTLSRTNARAESAAPTELNSLLSVFTQGCISGFALIPPWALQECRAYGTHASTNQPIQQAQTMTPNQSNNKHKQRHPTINQTTNANNDTAQPIRQQTQTTTPPNQ